MNEGLRVLIVTPTYVPDITGNAITAGRLYRGLRNKGVGVEVIVGAYANIPLPLKPDIIHALHALKGGVPTMEAAGRLGVPFVVTITGTDLNIDLIQLENPQILNVLKKAERVVVYSRLAKERLSSKLPSISEKINVIRPSVGIGRPKGKRSLPAGFNFLLPSGIRKVKAPSFAIGPLAALHKELPSINLTIVGPVLDETEWLALSDAMNGKDWIFHMKVSYEEMPDIYSSANVVLNTSVSEGISNAVLEAMSIGKVVLASDCEGNRTVISDGHDGILYHQGDEEDFIQKARGLIIDAELRERLGKAAKEKVAKEYGLDAEVEGHLRLYQDVLQG